MSSTNGFQPPSNVEHCAEHRIALQQWGCEVCLQTKHEAAVRAAFAAATKISPEAYTGDIVCLDVDGGYYPDIYDIDRGELLEVDGVRFAWGTVRGPSPTVDLETECQERWLDNEHEDAIEEVDFDKLAQAQALVNEALSAVHTYYADYSVAVVVPEENG